MWKDKDELGTRVVIDSRNSSSSGSGSGGSSIIIKNNDCSISMNSIVGVWSVWAGVL